MVGSRTRFGSKLDTWSDLLSGFVGVTNAQQTVAMATWRELLSVFAGMRNALQTAVGEPSASRCTFNVFEVTRRSGFEVTTHSALLCDLLDPRGTHGQGGAFLQAFLAMIDDKLPRSTSRAPWPPADGWWNVVPEFAAAQGRLDILLTNRGPSGPATIVIENKWGHGVGDLQLERYGEYLVKQRPLGEGHRKCLVYLTRSGEDPGIRAPVDFARLSHSLHIAGVLQDTLETSGDTVPSALREPLLQYLHILGDDYA
jgi:PD-(D/E)XK nuclease superfamily